jgi:hypothetical protein
MSHKVSFAVPKRELGRADLRFDVSQEDGKLGTLAVSKGAVVWFPKDHSYGYKINWTDVDRIFSSQGTRSEKR